MYVKFSGGNDVIIWTRRVGNPVVPEVCCA